ncbi:hypothetical protein MSSAC_2387 [Methanosarcina siciliae C2J]|uniref:Zona occludens toxin N-terminal domain-containing protein n=1 Tax=Methanosarcina siciliae C2J TaxID=1434118 RepID=A0A0E3PN55_9EURY|nr:hypothetical protein [Methanosarcina siciliae]AKB36977.1 hypothetical protein MSSAC_2387 [Methanosarcina siciliae C2J]
MFYRVIPGTYCIQGPVRSGKTKVAVELTNHLLAMGVPTFSNFPLWDPKTGHVAYKYVPEKRHLLQDCVVLLDEAWGLGLKADDYRKIDPLDEEFFRKAGQNGVIIMVISQTAALKVIRECANMFIDCKCLHLPVTGMKKGKDGKPQLKGGYPLYFVHRFRQRYESKTILFTKKGFFNRYIGSCYNHLAWRNTEKLNYDDFEKWEPQNFKPFIPLRVHIWVWSYSILYVGLWFYTFGFFKDYKKWDKSLILAVIVVWIGIILSVWWYYNDLQNY